MEKSYKITESDLATAFTEWESRYRENPENFTEEKGEPQEYGKSCANYLLKILELK